MNPIRRFAPRIPLVLATFVFAMISIRFLADPVGAAAAMGIAFTKPVGITIGRIGFAAFPLGSAIVTLLCLISPRRSFIGLAFVAIMLTVALAVRILGIAVDHTMSESLRVTISEVVLLVASIAGMITTSPHRT